MKTALVAFFAFASTPLFAQSASFGPITKAGEWPGPGQTQINAKSVVVTNGLAYVAADKDGLIVLDIRDASNPVRIGGCNTDGWAIGITVVGNYAYVANNSAGMQIIDVSNPSNCALLGRFVDHDGQSINGVAVVGNYAYLSGFAGLQVIDVRNPLQPVRVGYCDDGSEGIKIEGRYAYVANMGLSIVDITEPTKPKRMYGYYGFSALDVAVSGKYAYLASYGDGVQIFDISNPDNLDVVTRFQVGGYAMSLAIAGNYAFIAAWGGGLQVFDISNHSKPVKVTNCDTGGHAQGVAINGNFIYVTDNGSGLQIFKIASAPSMQITRSPGKVKVIMNVNSGLKYQVESSINLTDWNPLGESFTADQDVFIREIGADTPISFFRLNNAK